MEIFLQLLLAVFLGSLLGLERQYKKKEAGLKTYSLVTLGSAFFVILAYQSLNYFSSYNISFDPTRIIGQIVLGVGFIGAGLIIFRGFHIEGLTTATGLWVASAIGVAVGLKMYFPAVFVTLLAVAVLSVFRIIEEKVFRKDEKG